MTQIADAYARHLQEEKAHKYAHLPKKYQYKRGNIEEARLGAYLYDVSFQEPTGQTVEETRQLMDKDYVRNVFECADEGKTRYKSPFYVMVCRKKAHLGLRLNNVMETKYCARQTSPNLGMLMEITNAWDVDLYECDAKVGEVKHIYTLPQHADWKHFLAQPEGDCEELKTLIRWAMEGSFEQNTQTGDYERCK